MTEITCPPLAAPKPVARDLWIMDSAPLRVMRVVPVRMTVVRPESGELVLHSPARQFHQPF